MTTRVQIPVYTDRWMMGDRYGEIVRVSKRARYVPRSQSPNMRVFDEIAHVRLDKSGKIVRVVLSDCEVV